MISSQTGIDDPLATAVLDAICFDAQGLVPAIAQQFDTGEVLMMAWMNREAVAETLATGRVCYFSRSRNALWRKGETSGQQQALHELRIDCDGDTLLVLVDQTGVACHTGRRSCFYRAARDGTLVEIAAPLVDPAKLYAVPGHGHAPARPAKLRIETVTGADVIPLLPAMARLRTIVFRDWPYLYEGDAAYEEKYLRIYAETPDAAVIAAYDGDEVVGVSTCLPLACETANIKAPFRALGLDPTFFFYFGESVLLKQYRGRGVGVDFFAAREAQALRDPTSDYATFCAVQRSPDDPRRPPDDTPLDAFWQKRGYTRYPDLSCTMSWTEIGQSEQTEKTLIFWIKSLRGAPLP